MGITVTSTAYGRYSPQRIAFICMVFLASWMTLLAGVLILRWSCMTEAEQALSIITPDQIMVNVFATIVFWGLVAVTKQNTTVAGCVGIVLYLLFALATVWAVGNKAAEINMAKGLQFGDPEWVKPLDMLTDPVAAVIHVLRLALLGFVIKAKWKADEHWDVVDEGAEAAAAVPDLVQTYQSKLAQQGYYTGAASIANDSTDWQVLEDDAPVIIAAEPTPMVRQVLGDGTDHTPTVRQIQRQPLHTTTSAQ